ncbi:MAG: ATPase P [Eubacterium sp.]|nr:ATPase P [Eubacterium sp.]
MVKTVLEIDGMMCGMCEAHMNDVIRKTIPDAKKVKSSHKKNMSRFVTEEKPDIDKLKKAVDEIGYKILSVNYE